MSAAVASTPAGVDRGCGGLQRLSGQARGELRRATVTWEPCSATRCNGHRMRFSDGRVQSTARYDLNDSLQRLDEALAAVHVPPR